MDFFPETNKRLKYYKVSFTRQVKAESWLHKIRAKMRLGQSELLSLWGDVVSAPHLNSSTGVPSEAYRGSLASLLCVRRTHTHTLTYTGTHTEDHTLMECAILSSACNYRLKPAESNFQSLKRKKCHSVSAAAVTYFMPPQVLADFTKVLHSL